MPPRHWTVKPAQTETDAACHACGKVAAPALRTASGVHAEACLPSRWPPGLCAPPIHPEEFFVNVTHLLTAQSYDPPGHVDMQGFRLQGGAVSDFAPTVGLSIFEPGGGAQLSSSASARVYVVTGGTLTVTAGGQTVELGPHDSCFIPAGEPRSIVNAGSLPATIITIICQA